MPMMTRALTLLLLALPLAAAAAIKTETVEYQDGDTRLTGYLTYDDSVSEKRPGVIVVHEWWGLNDYARKRAEMLAELGYVAFAVDMYGDNKVTEHASEASGWLKQITENVDAWQRRALAGLDVLKAHERVDGERLAAIGYCFGGATVMQMAYAGADLDGVASFHGSLPPPADDQKGNIKARVLVAHGAADAMVPPERVMAFQQALDAAGADWQLVSYGGAKHGFTNPGAGAYGMEALAYDPKADARSWALMQSFLTEVFGN
ncbi:MAG: dienelactone hydrolase family protein [Chromatiaceae bacterium]|nr:dienelactone hydrolase family protein [Chromatiaceae bacterium]